MHKHSLHFECCIIICSKIHFIALQLTTCDQKKKKNNNNKKMNGKETSCSSCSFYYHGSFTHIFVQLFVFILVIPTSKMKWNFFFRHKSVINCIYSGKRKGDRNKNIEIVAMHVFTFQFSLYFFLLLFSWLKEWKIIVSLTFHAVACLSPNKKNRK